MTKSLVTTELRTTDADNAARAQIMLLLLENNKLCPEGSMCTLPNAVHTIQLVPGGDEKLRHQAQYRLGADKEAALNKALEKLLALGAIAPMEQGEVPPCTSPRVVAAQMHLDGSTKFRACLAAMELNKLTVPCGRLVPLTAVPVASDYTKQSALDIENFFMQHPVAPKSQKYLAFVWKGRFYRYRTVVYGLLNAGAHCQSILEPALAAVVTKPSLVSPYVDDIRASHKTLARMSSKCASSFEHSRPPAIASRLQSASSTGFPSAPSAKFKVRGGRPPIPKKCHSSSNSCRRAS
jgi:hypothetical protein